MTNIKEIINRECDNLIATIVERRTMATGQTPQPIEAIEALRDAILQSLRLCEDARVLSGVFGAPVVIDPEGTGDGLKWVDGSGRILGEIKKCEAPKP